MAGDIPEEKDSKVGKDLEDMTAEELSFRMCDLDAESSDVFRKGGSDKEVKKIDAEIERCHDVFKKLTGMEWGEWGRLKNEEVDRAYSEQSKVRDDLEKLEKIKNQEK